jgi:hypothetical protein
MSIISWLSLDNWQKERHITYLADTLKLCNYESAGFFMNETDYVGVDRLVFSFSIDNIQI